MWLDNWLREGRSRPLATYDTVIVYVQLHFGGPHFEYSDNHYTGEQFRGTNSVVDLTVSGLFNMVYMSCRSLIQWEENRSSNVLNVSFLAVRV